MLIVRLYLKILLTKINTLSASTGICSILIDNHSNNSLRLLKSINFINTPFLFKKLINYNNINNSLALIISKHCFIN